MAITSWRTLIDRALEENRDFPGSHFVALATARDDGRPANRMVVYRGFLSESDQLLFTTDLRSRKAAQISINPWVEATWYFHKTWEQFRIAGVMAVVGADLSNIGLIEAREECWQSLSESTRRQFAWPPPGQSRAEPSAFHGSELDLDEPPNTFGLLVLQPVEVEHLDLKPDPHHRTRYWLDRNGASWSSLAINP